MHLLTPPARIFKFCLPRAPSLKLIIILIVISSKLDAQYCFFVFGFKRALSTSSEEGTCKSEPAKKMARTDTCDGDDADNGVVIKVAIKERKDTVDNNKRYSGVKESE